MGAAAQLLDAFTKTGLCLCLCEVVAVLSHMTCLRNRGQDCGHRKLQAGKPAEARAGGRVARRDALLAGQAYCSVGRGLGSRRRAGRSARRAAVSDETTALGGARGGCKGGGQRVGYCLAPADGMLRRPRAGPLGNGMFAAKQGSCTRSHTLTGCALAAGRAPGHGLERRVGLGELRCSVGSERTRMRGRRRRGRSTLR